MQVTIYYYTQLCKIITDVTVIHFTLFPKVCIGSLQNSHKL